MAIELPDDIFHVIARLVDKATLAALCLVSTGFHNTFTPMLYENVNLDRCELSLIESVAQLPSKSHLSHVKRLRLGKRISSTDHWEITFDILTNLLERTTALKSFIIGPPLLRHFADPQSQNAKIQQCSYESDAASNTDPTLKSVPLQLLSRLKTIEGVSFIGSHEITRFSWTIPPFINLRLLALEKMERECSPGKVEDIAKVLVASPRLKSLSLSLQPSHTGFSNDSLQTLCNSFREKRGSNPPLNLECLHLGLGYLPVKPNTPSIDDYLSQLTDLQSLTEIRFDNSGVEYSTWDFPDWEIHPALFNKATNLQKLSVERFGDDIATFIKIVSSKHPGKLDQLEVSRYIETLEHGDRENDRISNNQTFLSVGIPSCFGWRTLSFGMKISNAPEDITVDILYCVSRCVKIEELAMPVDWEHIRLFEEHVLPKLRKLRVLMITRSEPAALRVRTSSSRDGYVSHEKVIELEDDNSWWQEDREAQRVNLAKDFFQSSRRLWEEDHKREKLRYVGLGRHVYVDDSWGKSQELKLVKLDNEQARSFEIVRRLDEEVEDWFSLRGRYQ